MGLTEHEGPVTVDELAEGVYLIRAASPSVAAGVDAESPATDADGAVWRPRLTDDELRARRRERRRTLDRLNGALFDDPDAHLVRHDDEEADDVD